MTRRHKEINEEYAHDNNNDAREEHDKKIADMYKEFDEKRKQILTEPKDKGYWTSQPDWKVRASLRSF